MTDSVNDSAVEGALPDAQDAELRRVDVASLEPEMREYVEQLQADKASLESERAMLKGKVIELQHRNDELAEHLPAGEQALRAKLNESTGKLQSALAQNEKLSYTLKEAREHITALRLEVDKLTKPPSSFGSVIAVTEDGYVDIFATGRKFRVAVDPNIDPSELKRGREVVLNESLAVVAVTEYTSQGEIVTIKALLGPGPDGIQRAIIATRIDEKRVVEIADSLADVPLREGTQVLLDSRTGYLLEVIPESDVEALTLEEVPDITYADIGGLKAQLKKIQNAIELPFERQALFARYKQTAPKGVLLYGPPGCGKTLIAKAIANSLQTKVREHGNPDARSYFLNIKGPELLNMFVGETERQIREVFKRARAKAEAGNPVIIFFDEMDALFRTRGHGISSDMESTIVPQLLVMIDGLEQMKNVIVIGASNREETIDPAVLRAGRIDRKIKVERPDEIAAIDIFRKYLTADIPIHPDEFRGAKPTPKAVHVVLERMIAEVAHEMYDRGTEKQPRLANQFMEVTYEDGHTAMLYFADLNSGAMIDNIVKRAKEMAILEEIALEDEMVAAGRDAADVVGGVTTNQLIQAVRDEFKENEDMQNLASPDEADRIAGTKGQRIVRVRLMHAADVESASRGISNVATGQYL